MFSFVCLAAFLIVATDAVWTENYQSVSCEGFEQVEDVYKSEDCTCDTQPTCNSNGMLETTFLRGNCRPRCCDNEVVLNAKTFGVNFDAHLASKDTSRACKRLIEDYDIIDAFKFGSKLSTTCISFQIVIDVAHFRDISGWSVCFIRFNTVKISSVDITVSQNKPIKIKNPSSVSQRIDQIGDRVIITFYTNNDGSTVCNYDVKNIEIVVCPLPPVSTAPPTTTIQPITPQPSRFCNITLTPLVNFVDDLGRVCNSANGQGLFQSTCSGACPTNTQGQIAFTNGACVQPSVNSVIEKCQCCTGAGQWVSYPTSCSFPGSGVVTPSTINIFQLTTCDCK